MSYIVERPLYDLEIGQRFGRYGPTAVVHRQRATGRCQSSPAVRRLKPNASTWRVLDMGGVAPKAVASKNVEVTALPNSPNLKSMVVDIVRFRGLLRYSQQLELLAQ